VHSYKNDKFCCPLALLGTKTACGPCWRAVLETRAGAKPADKNLE